MYLCKCRDSRYTDMHRHCAYIYRYIHIDRYIYPCIYPWIFIHISILCLYGCVYIHTPYSAIYTSMHTLPVNITIDTAMYMPIPYICTHIVPYGVGHDTAASLLALTSEHPDSSQHAKATPSETIMEEICTHGAVAVRLGSHRSADGCCWVTGSLSRAPSICWDSFECFGVLEVEVGI